MGTHGSESFFVLDEGLLGEAAGGREPTLALAPDVAAITPPFRFSRLGPKGDGKQLTEANRKKIGALMAAGTGGQGQIPAGFTYLGQFTDHDLTFDKTIVTFGDKISPAQLQQNRSPSLDLDSLYGAGPADPESAKFYEADSLHLKTGKSKAAGGFAALDGFDLPRGAGTTNAEKRTAIIPDPRNDENLAVAQTHCAMIRFHNRVVDTLPAAVPQSQRFVKARELVTKHYQWMLRTDYLPRICAEGVVNDVFNNGHKAFEVGVRATDVPTMPIEFSVGAFRMGHSMVRAAYNWNKVFDDGTGTLDYMFIFSALGGDLGGETRLISTWIADFRRLYDFGEANKPNLEVPANKFNRAMRIDTSIVDPLRHLPPHAIGGPASMPFNDPDRNLAFRNLARANMVTLATGQQMATFLRSKGGQSHQAHERPDPRGPERHRARGADPDAATGPRPEHAAVVLHPARGRVQRWQAEGGGGAHRRGDLSPRDGGKPILDPQRRRLASDARPEQPHVPDGGSAPLRVRKKEEPVGSAGLASGATPGPGPRATPGRDASRPRSPCARKVRLPCGSCGRPPPSRPPAPGPRHGRSARPRDPSASRCALPAQPHAR